jgi:hypothetical protein
MLANPTYKKMYIAHMKTIMNENFANGLYLDSANAIMTAISGAVNADPYKFFSYAQFQSSLSSNTTGTGGGPGGSSIPGIQVLMDARNSYLQSTTEFQQIAPNLINPNAGPVPIPFGTTFHFYVEATNASEVWVGYRLDKSKRFNKIQMFDDGMHDDGGANDGVYGAPAMANGTYVQYYFYAQNNNAGLFLPARAEHEYFDLNFAYSSVNTGEVVINEFLSNNNIQLDEYAESNDWIELYNNTSEIKSLDGLYLTDDATNSVLWAFPANTHIAPHGFLMIWADDDQWQTIRHTNFNLSSLSGVLQLTNGSQIIDQISYGSQSPDISFGRFPNGTGNFQPMSTSFHATNNGSIGREESAENILHIYPNPFHDSFQIQSEDIISQIEIYNGWGALIFQQKQNTNLNEIPTQDWVAGIYYVRIKTQNGKVMNKKLVKH